MADLELTTDATVPTNTSLTITVYEDIDADGTAENSASQSISGGTNTYTLSGFDGSSGNDVWVQAEPANTDVTTTASLNSADVQIAVSAPSTPQNLTSTVSQDDITLDWDAVNWNGDQGHYDIKRAQTSGGAYTEITTVASGTTTYTDSGLEDGERYYYVVEADNSAGGSGNSNETDETTVLPAPSNISTTQV